MSMKEIKIIPLTLDKVNELKDFTDTHIGKNYYSIDDLKEIYKKSILNGENSSFLLLEDDKIKGIRLAYMPGNWHSGKGTEGLTPQSWKNISLHELGYFQSLFLAQDFIGKGWAPVLANLSIDAIKKAGGKGILTHSWLESPNNSSRRYLEKVGFQLVKEHPNYWINVNYICPRCGNPCVCTAGEMLLVLKKDTP